jgi:DNA-binding NtrC family response regulator
MVADREIDPDLLPASDFAEGELATEIVGDSFAAQQLRRAVVTVAATTDPVLILGETGTGKEVTARAIHRLSGRKGPFVAVNCAAIPVDLAEAEFFGYRKGAFTGAETDRPGYFAQSSGGTLFLDEVGELPPTLQAKLLRTLEDGCIQPLGGGAPVEIDLRVVAATNADLGENGFRTDLLARLEDWVLHLFPLTRRRADIIPLWEHFLGDADKKPGRSVGFTEALLLHDWPLNARALRKIARRLAALAGQDAEWSLSHLPTPIRRTSTIREEVDRAPPNREELETALDAAGGNVSKVAAQLGYDRKQIYRWMQKLGLAPERFRATGNGTT